MNDLIKQIQSEIDSLNENLNKYKQGNKTAGLRARKCTLDLEKLFKTFRKESVKNDKK